MRSRVAIVALACACGKSPGGTANTSGSATGSAGAATGSVSGSAAGSATGSAGAGSGSAAGSATGSGSGSGSGAGSAAGARGITCEALPFAASTPVPEASGAAWLEIDGKPLLVVVGDSGQHGAYGLVDPDTGATVEQGTLPLGNTPITDDLEGLAARDGTLYGLISPGWILTWKRAGKGSVRRSGGAPAGGAAAEDGAATRGFALVDGPYPLGPVDLPTTKGIGDKPPKGDGLVCEARGTNCGRNYEGLCLRPRDPRGVNPLLCTGFAASKADGHLYCLTEGEHGRLVVHKDRDEAGPDGVAFSAHRAIAVDRPGVVADCAYAPDGTLWVGDNLFGLSQVFRVDGDGQPEMARVVPIAQIGQGFSEVIAARGDVIYRMSDTGGSPSLMAKFRCTPSAR